MILFSKIGKYLIFSVDMHPYFKPLIGCIVLTIVCSEIINAQARYQVIISELMPDPAPSVGLPEAEWLELKNISNAPINLQGMRLGKSGGALSGAIPAVTLAPDSAVVLCSAAQVNALASLGRTISVTSFPSLANEADLVFLQSAGGEVLHAVAYDLAWYKNPVKQEGGWSLEMIDTRFPCSGMENWQASTSVVGGTPGQPNAAGRNQPDVNGPQLLGAFAPSPQTVLLSFDEPLHPAIVDQATRYMMSEGISVIAAQGQPPLYNRVLLTLGSPMQEGIVYTVKATTLTDCAGNLLGGPGEARAGLAAAADTHDVVVNEILFNPPDFGADYVELYNRSKKIINLRTLSLANRSTGSGTIGSIRAISATDRLLFPGDYLVVTETPEAVRSQYTVANPGALLRMSSLPSFPSNAGRAIVLDGQGKIIDELPYDEKWHFALMDNRKGVALERIDYDAPTGNPENWTSAAQSAGFGTPTAKNSQVRTSTAIRGSITIEPPVFSPDNDGFDDFALIRFSFSQAGYVANITLFDAAGRLVRVLQRNTTCAASGSFRWDGLDDKQLRVAPGTYVVFTEIFNLQGQKQVFKNTVTVARKF